MFTTMPPQNDYNPPLIILVKIKNRQFFPQKFFPALKILSAHLRNTKGSLFYYLHNLVNFRHNRAEKVKKLHD